MQTKLGEAKVTKYFLIMVRFSYLISTFASDYAKHTLSDLFPDGHDGTFFIVFQYEICAQG